MPLFLGAKSAGYVTAIAGFQVANGLYLYLSTGYGRDPEGEMYEKELVPDIYNDGPDSFDDIPNDKKVLQAIK